MSTGVGTAAILGIIIAFFAILVMAHSYQSLKSEQNNLSYCEWLVNKIAGDKATGRANVTIAELSLYQTSCSS